MNRLPRPVHTHFCTNASRLLVLTGLTEPQPICDMSGMLNALAKRFHAPSPCIFASTYPCKLITIDGSAQGVYGLPPLGWLVGRVGKRDTFKNCVNLLYMPCYVSIGLWSGFSGKKVSQIPARLWSGFRACPCRLAVLADRNQQG